MTTQAEFLDKIYQAAISIGVPEPQARLAATQAALESSYGRSAPGNNYFGIKGSGQTLATKEGVGGNLVSTSGSFRKYATPEESVADWWAQLNRNWPDAAGALTFADAVAGLKYGRLGAYATDGVEANDPLTYGDKLGIINNRVPALSAIDSATKWAPSLASLTPPPLPIPRPPTPQSGPFAALPPISNPFIKDPVQTPSSVFGGRLPAQAQFGVDRLNPSGIPTPVPPPNAFTSNLGTSSAKANDADGTARRPSWIPSSIPTPPQAPPAPMSRPSSLSAFPVGSTINVHADGSQSVVPLAGSVAMPPGVRPNVPALPNAPQINPAFTAWQAQYGGLPTGTSQNTVSEKFDGGSMGSVPLTPPVVPPMPNRYLPQSPAPMARPSAPASSGNYTIRYGDTLNSIAQQTGIPVATLAAANGISDPNKIFAGQSLNLSGAPRPASSGGSMPTAPSPMSMPVRASGNGSSSGGASSGGSLAAPRSGGSVAYGAVVRGTDGYNYKSTPTGFVNVGRAV